MGFALAAVGLFVIGDVTRTGWIQIADALLWGTLAASAVVAGLSGTRIEMTPRLGWHGSTGHGAGGLGPFQSDDAQLVVEVRNPRPWPRVGATISFDLHVNGQLTTPDDGSRVRLFNEGEFRRVNEAGREERSRLEGRREELAAAVADQVSRQEGASALPARIKSFLKDFQSLDVQRAKAMLQPILKSVHVYNDGRIELEFRGPQTS